MVGDSKPNLVEDKLDLHWAYSILAKSNVELSVGLTPLIGKSNLLDLRWTYVTPTDGLS